MPPELEETLTEKCKIQKTPIKLPIGKGPLSMNKGKAPYGKLEHTILIASKKSQFGHRKCSMEGIDGGTCENDNFGCGGMKARVLGSMDLESLRLEGENVARVVTGRIMAMRFFPSNDMRMIFVGNKSGDVGFLNVDSEEEDVDGIYVYHSHSAPVSGIAVQPFSISKRFTCCYDGFIRMMDVEKETYDLAYSSNGSMYSLSQRPNDMTSLYFDEGEGGLGIWDERA